MARKFYGGHHGYKGVPKKKVKKLTKGLLKDEKRDLKGQRKSVKRQSTRDRNEIKRDHAATKGDLNKVFGETAGYQRHLGKQTDQAYQAAAGRQTAAQQALQSRLGDVYGGAQQGLTSELERLGIGRSANIQGLTEDAAYSQARAAQSGQDASSTLSQAQTNAASMNQLLQGMTRGSQMSQLGQALRGKREALQGVRDQRSENLSKIQDAITSVNESRPDLFFQLLNQLQETGWGQYLQGEQLRRR